MWFYYLMGLRSLWRLSTKPEFEEDRKRLKAMNDQFNEDMRNWTPETSARYRAAGYHFVGRLGILAIIVFLLCWAWSYVITKHEEQSLIEYQQSFGDNSCLMEHNWDKIQCIDWKPGGVYHHLIPGE
jgi:hypothetical protein